MGELSEEQLLLLDNLMYYKDSTKPEAKVGDIAQQIVYGVSEEDLQGGITPEQAQDFAQDILADEELCNLQVACSTDENGLRATCFVDEQGEATVAIRGTGGSYEAWSDNVEGAYDMDTSVQEEMKSFIENDCVQYDNITVTGHSKGGCMAQYVTVQCGDKVDRCVSYDGQGFNREFHETYSDEIAQNSHKIKSISANTEAVNTLLYSVAGETVYLNTDPDINAHSSYGLYKANKGTCNENGVYSQQVEQSFAMKALDVVGDSLVDGLSMKPDFVEKAVTDQMASAVGLGFAVISDQFRVEALDDFVAKQINGAVVGSAYFPFGLQNKLDKTIWHSQQSYNLGKYAADLVVPMVKKYGDKIKEKIQNAKKYATQKAVQGCGFALALAAQEKDFRDKYVIAPLVLKPNVVQMVTIPDYRGRFEIDTDRIKNQIEQLESSLRNMEQVQERLSAI